MARYLRDGTPCILTGAPLSRDLTGRWSFDYLAEHYAGPPSLNVHFAPRSSSRFTRFYGQGVSHKGKGGIFSTSFREYAETCRKNERAADPPWRYYMQALLMWSECGCDKKAEPRGIVGGVIDAAGDNYNHAPLGRELEEDLRRIDYGWLRKACEACGCDGLYDVNLWAGASGGCTPLHYDTTCNFLTQLAGRKRLLLFPPSMTYNLYPYPASHPMNAFSMVDVESPDLARFPAAAHARGLEATLEPGDVLWLPCHYWHYVKQFEGDETISLNFWMGAKSSRRGETMLRLEKANQHVIPGELEVDAFARRAFDDGEQLLKFASKDETEAEAEARERRFRDNDDALLRGEARGEARAGVAGALGSGFGDPTVGLSCMQMGRHLESEATQCVGQEDYGRFLSAMALGADSRWPDSPVRERAQQIRSHLLTVLGARRAGALLRAMTRDGRLHPGLAPRLAGAIVGTEETHLSSFRELRAMADGGWIPKSVVSQRVR